MMQSHGNTPSDQNDSVIGRARKAAQVAYGEFKYEEVPAADAAMRVVFEHLLETYGPDSWDFEREIKDLLKQVSP